MTDLTSTPTPIFQNFPLIGISKAFDTPGNTPWEREKRVMIMKEASTLVPGEYEETIFPGEVEPLRIQLPIIAYIGLETSPRFVPRSQSQDQ